MSSNVTVQEIQESLERYVGTLWHYGGDIKGHFLFVGPESSFENTSYICFLNLDQNTKVYLKYRPYLNNKLDVPSHFQEFYNMRPAVTI